jgi:hypothetical protein
LRYASQMPLMLSVICEESNMTIDKTLPKKWYLTLIAGSFLILCGASSMRYLAMNVSLIEGFVPISTQILCFAGTVAAIVYFIKPMFGCSGLLAVCLCAMVLSVQAADAKAIVFYAIIISALLVSILGSLRRNLR